MSDKLIFLDIDGPMIPSYMYVLEKNPSFNRHFSPVAVRLLSYLLNKVDAKLVTKSMHNYYLSKNTNDLKTDLINSGIDEKHFHENWRTSFGEPGSWISRKRSVEEWLQENGDYDWVDFDDELIGGSERYITVDFEEGLNLKHINAALEVWQQAPVIIL